MKYYFVLFYLFNFYVFSSTTWNVESLIQHLKNILQEGLQSHEFLLIDSVNIIKDKDLGLINSKQTELFKNYNISTYIFILNSIKEGRKKFSANLVKKLPTIHNKIDIANSITLVINMNKKKTHFIYGKKVTRFFSNKKKKIIRKELYNYLKMKKESEGIVIVLQKILEELKIKTNNYLMIAIIVLVIFTLFILFTKKNPGPNLLNKTNKSETKKTN